MKTFVTKLLLNFFIYLVYNRITEIFTESRVTVVAKRIIAMLMVLCVILGLSAVLLPTAAADTASAPAVVEQGATEVRFLNMLNHNYVYDDAFNYTDDVVNNSIVALLDLRDSADEDYIAQGYVADYVKNMYGIEIVDFAGLNADFPQKDGFVFIIPRGFETYSHTLVDCRENEDGSFTVTTDVVIDTHYGELEEGVATTLFVKNSESDFGYNIVYSNITVDGTDI